jgi:hypothetical protein
MVIGISTRIRRLSFRIVSSRRPRCAVAFVVFGLLFPQSDVLADGAVAAQSPVVVGQRSDFAPIDLRGVLLSAASHPGDRLLSGRATNAGRKWIQSPWMQAGLRTAAALVEQASSLAAGRGATSIRPIVLLAPESPDRWSPAELVRITQEVPHARRVAARLGLSPNVPSRFAGTAVVQLSAALNAWRRDQFIEFAKSCVVQRFRGAPVVLCWSADAAARVVNGSAPAESKSYTIVGSSQPLAILLRLAPALPELVLGQDQTFSAGSVSSQPRFHALAWSPPKHSNPSNVFPVAWATSWRSVLDTASDLAAVPSTYQAVLVFGDLGTGLFGSPEDALPPASGLARISAPSASPWMTNGMRNTRLRFEAYIAKLHAAGARPSTFLFDNEMTPTATWFIGGNIANWDSVMQDERFGALASELGFSDLYQIQWNNAKFHAWERVMSRRFDDAMNFAFTQPIMRLYPTATVSNYESYQLSPSFSTPDCSGFRQVRETEGVGGRQARPFYGTTSAQLADCAFDGASRVGSSPFEVLRREVHAIRALRNSSAAPVDAWVANKSWGGHPFPTPLSHSPYWDELILQLGMNGTDRFVYWTEVTMPYWAHHNTDDRNPAADSMLLDQLLRELDRVAPAGPRSARPQPLPSFGDELIASFASDSGGTIWRFSFDPQLAGVVLTTSDGRSIELRRETARPGAWLRLPAGLQLKMGSGGRLPLYVPIRTVDVARR